MGFKLPRIAGAIQKLQASKLKPHDLSGSLPKLTSVAYPLLDGALVSNHYCPRFTFHLIRLVVTAVMASLLSFVAMQAVVPAANAALDPWTLSMTVNKTEVGVGESFTLKATSNPQTTASTHYIHISDQGTGTRLAQCRTGFGYPADCSFTTTLPSGTASKVFYATVAAFNQSGVQATSNTVSVTAKPLKVHLTASRQVLKAGQPATLTATTNQSVDTKPVSGTHFWLNQPVMTALNMDCLNTCLNLCLNTCPSVGQQSVVLQTIHRVVGGSWCQLQPEVLPQPSHT